MPTLNTTVPSLSHMYVVNENGKTSLANALGKLHVLFGLSLLPVGNEETMSGSPTAYC